MKPIHVALAVLLCGQSFATPVPASPVMLAGPWLPKDPHQLDFHILPNVPSEPAIISNVRAGDSATDKLDHHHGGVNQRNYLAHLDGQFWAIWSDGPGIEDRVGQLGLRRNQQRESRRSSGDRWRALDLDGRMIA